MKKLILVVLGLSTLIGLSAYLRRPSTPLASSIATSMETAPALEQSSNHSAELSTAQSGMPLIAAEPRPDSATAASPAPTAVNPDPNETVAVGKLEETLFSPQATRAEKRAAWKQLRESGKLDQAISDLEQRVSADPRSGDYQSVLGQAYLQKCATTKDVREQGVLALQADKLFENALNLDPSNWEARFTKAVAMSYWPASMNKGQEVIENFQTLLQQQETQAAQPHFAETYAWLGDQYQKAGQGEEARAVWQRGASLFPNDDGLKRKLATP